MGPARSICYTVGQLPTSQLQSCYLGRAFPLPEVIPRFERLQFMLRTVANCLAIEDLPEDHKNRISGPANDLNTWFSQVSAVPDSHQNPLHQYEQFRRQFDSVEASIHRDVLPASAIAAGLESGLSRKSLPEGFTSEIAAMQARATEAIEKIQTAMSAAEQSAAQAEKARERAAADATIMAIQRSSRALTMKCQGTEGRAMGGWPAWWR